MTPLTPAQRDVLTIIADRGPLADDEAASLIHHRFPRDQASSGVRTRRKELQDRKLVRPVGHIQSRSGRKLRTFEATARGKRLV